MRKKVFNNMETGINQIVMDEITDIAKKNGIIKVILFGSRSRGDYHRASDIDLAVIGKDVTGFSNEVQEDTSTLLDFDIINLENDLQDGFRKQIMKEGIVIYEKV